jgi:hypothetical protein
MEHTNATAYKLAAGFFSGLVIATFSWWIAIGKSAMSREEVQAYVAHEQARQDEIIAVQMHELKSADAEAAIKLNLVSIGIEQARTELAAVETQLRMHRVESLKHYNTMESQIAAPPKPD